MIYLGLMLRVFVHVHPLILVYYVFPKISKMRVISFFDRSFMYAAPLLWKALDLDIRLFKTHLYLKYFLN